MEDIIAPIGEVVVPAEGQVSVFLDIQMPVDSFEGLLAGGITFMEVEEEDGDVEGSESESAGFGIQNRFAFVMAIVLRNEITAIDPELNLGNVEAHQQNRRNQIRANLQNATPVFVNQLALEAIVTGAGSDEVLFEISREGMQMAPNSNMNFPIPLDGVPFESGDFTLHLTASSFDHEWEFTQDFTIEAEVAETFNATDVLQRDAYEPASNTLWYIIGGAILLVGTNAVTFYYRKKRKVA